MQFKEYITKKYIMKLPMILIAVVIGFFDMRALGLKELSTLFYACYIYFFIGVVVGVELLRRRDFVSVGLILMSIVLLLISRDKILTVNILASLGVILFILFMISDRLEKWVFPAFVLVNIIYFSITKTDNRLIIICLIVGLFYSLCMLAGKDMRYRYIVPFMLLFVFLMPVKDKPIRWQFMRDIFNKIADYAGGFAESIGLEFDGMEIGTSYSGYSGVGTLHGAVEGEAVKDILFKKNGKSKTLYLKGGQFSTITKDGFKDKQNITPYYNEWFVTFMNALMNSDITRKEAVCFIKVESAEVKYENLKTKDVIYPATLLSIDQSLENGLDKRVGKGFQYKIKYFVLDYASPYYKKVAENMAPDFSSDNYTGFKLHTYEEVSQYTYDILKIRLSTFMSKERYDQIVSRISSGSYKEELSQYLDTSMSNERIYNLSQELTKNCKNDYEKVKVIEDYVRKYDYSTDVDLRGSDNYIDAFLFEVHGGYCVHFASSMILLLRDAGIPARYVSGYLYEVNDEHVMSSDAHAWVEAYIDGIGWVNFEPTASIAPAKSWGLVASSDDKESDATDWGDYYEGEVKEPDIEKGKEYYEQYQQPEPANEKKDNKVKSEIVKKILFYVIYIVGAFVLLILLAVLFRRLWFRLLPPEKKLREMVRKTCRRIEKDMESEKEKEELQKNTASLYDYMKYVSEEDKSKTRELFDTYYRVRFRGDSVSNEEVGKLLKGA